MDITASAACNWTAIHQAEHDWLHIVSLFLIYIKINIPHEFWWLFSVSRLKYTMLSHQPLQSWLSGPWMLQQYQVSILALRGHSPAFHGLSPGHTLPQTDWEDSPPVTSHSSQPPRMCRQLTPLPLALGTIGQGSILEECQPRSVAMVTPDLKRWARWCCHLQSPESCQGMFPVPLGSSYPTAAMVVSIAPLTRALPGSELQLRGHSVNLAPVLPLFSAHKSRMVCQGARLSFSGREKHRLHGSERNLPVWKEYRAKPDGSQYNLLRPRPWSQPSESAVFFPIQILFCLWGKVHFSQGLSSAIEQFFHPCLHTQQDLLAKLCARPSSEGIFEWAASEKTCQELKMALSKGRDSDLQSQPTYLRVETLKMSSGTGFGLPGTPS